MDHIHNDDLWYHKINMAEIVGDFCKICMEKSFFSDHISAKEEVIKL